MATKYRKRSGDLLNIIFKAFLLIFVTFCLFILSGILDSIYRKLLKWSINVEEKPKLATTTGVFVPLYDDLSVELQSLQRGISKIDKGWDFGSEFLAILELADKKPTCPTEPPCLVGSVEFDAEIQLGVGGSGKPTKCIPEHRTTVVIPKRSDEDDGSIIALVKILAPILRRQQLEFSFLAISSSNPGMIGKLFNAAYFIANKQLGATCLLLYPNPTIAPIDDRNILNCLGQPRQLVANSVEFGNERPPMVISITSEKLYIIDGFAEDFAEWDNLIKDFKEKLDANRLLYLEQSDEIGQFKQIHSNILPSLYSNVTRDDVNAGGIYGFGLQDAAFTMLSFEEKELYYNAVVHFDKRPR